MKQSYDFEQYTPPVLHEAMLRAELERRRLQREIVMAAAGGILLLLGILLLAVLAYERWPVLSVVNLLYLCAAVTGDTVIALVYLRKRRSFSCQEPL